MGLWGKIIGGTAGFFVGGPYGAVIGAALGHAADSGSVQTIRRSFDGNGQAFNPARVAGMFGRRDEVFAITVTVLAAKLCKVDGPVTRAPKSMPSSAISVSPRPPPAGSPGCSTRRATAPIRSSPTPRNWRRRSATTALMLEQVLGSLFSIARADGPLNAPEQEFLRRVHRRLLLDQWSWDRAFGETPRRPAPVDESDPYLELGVPRSSSGEELRAAWKRLMRENHPDTLASRGVPAEFVARASDKVARINAAWDRIKRERGL